jgi:excisionase family DNA binding protein
MTPLELDENPLTIDQVAELLGVSEVTVRRYYTHDGLPVHRLGRARNAQVRFFRGEVLAWLRSRCTAPTPAQPKSKNNRKGRK